MASRHQSPSSPFDALLKPGDVACIKNLASHQNKALNGKWAKAVRYDPRAEAWTCLVEPLIDGAAFRKVLLKFPENLKLPAPERKEEAQQWAATVKLGGRKTSRPAPKAAAFRTIRSSSSSSKPPRSARTREATQRRLMQSIKAHPPRAKAPRTDRSREAAATLAHVKDPFDDRAGDTNVPIEERAPFHVQTGRRRTHRSKAHAESLSADKGPAGWTTDDRVLKPRSFRGTPQPVWDQQRYPEDPIEPEWHPWQLQESWAPEPDALARKLVRLRSKLRGVRLDDPSIQPAGSHDGPDLYC